MEAPDVICDSRSHRGSSALMRLVRTAEVVERDVERNRSLVIVQRF